MRLNIVIPATQRLTRGKNEARRCRVTGMIPAVIYGAFKESESITINPKDIIKIIRSKTGHNSIFDVNVEGVGLTPVIVSDEQYHPVKGNLLHVDLKRIDMSHRIKVSIPTILSGESKAVKQAGGLIDFVTRRVDIECLPEAIPDQFIVDVTDFNMGSVFRVSDLKVADGVKIITPADSIIGHVVGIKEDPTAAAAVVEPEVAKGKGKKPAAPAAAPVAAAAPAKKK